MALINRVSRLFKADLHAVLDRIEEPDVMLKQAVREMEQDIVQDEKQLKGLNIEREHLARKISQIDDKLTELDEEIDLCFESKNESLAKTLVKRKLEAKRFATGLSQKVQNIDNAIEDQIKRLEENRSRLEHIQQKIEIVLDEEKSAFTEEAAGSELHISDDDVEVAFLREKKMRAEK